MPDRYASLQDRPANRVPGRGPNLKARKWATMLRTAALGALRAARSGSLLESAAARGAYVVSGASKQASVQPQAAVPALAFARGFAAAAEPALAPSSEGTVTQVCDVLLSRSCHRQQLARCLHHLDDLAAGLSNVLPGQTDAVMLICVLEHQSRAHCNSYHLPLRAADLWQVGHILDTAFRITSAISRFNICSALHRSWAHLSHPLHSLPSHR